MILARSRRAGIRIRYCCAWVLPPWWTPLHIAFAMYCQAIPILLALRPVLVLPVLFSILTYNLPSRAPLFSSIMQCTFSPPPLSLCFLQMIGCDNPDCRYQWVSALPIRSLLWRRGPPGTQNTVAAGGAAAVFLSFFLGFSICSFLSNVSFLQISVPLISIRVMSQFHLPCVNLKPPLPDQWYCDDCLQLFGSMHGGSERKKGRKK